MNDGLVWLAPILCLFHLLSTPFFFIKVKDYGRFLIGYILYTIGITVGIWWSLSFLPSDMGFGGMIFAIPLLIPIVLTAPIVVLVRTIYHLTWLARQRRQNFPFAEASYPSADHPGGASASEEWPPHVPSSPDMSSSNTASATSGHPSGSAPPADTAVPHTVRPNQGPSYSPPGGPRPDAYSVFNRPAQREASPGNPRRQALKDFLCIVAISAMIVFLASGILTEAIAILSVFMPGMGISSMFVVRMFLGADPVWSTIGALLLNITVGELVWRYWTRRISPPASPLFARPMSYHVSALALLALLPLFRLPLLLRQQAVMTRSEIQGTKQQDAVNGGSVHPAVGMADLRTGNPVILSASFTPMDEMHMNSRCAVWLEHDNPRHTGPKMGVFRFSDASVRMIQLPFFANADGYNDNVSLYLLNRRVVALGSRQVATVDLQTGAIDSAPFRADILGRPLSSTVPALPEVTLVCDGWLVSTLHSGDTTVSVLNLRDFKRRSFELVDGEYLCGVTQDTLIVKSWFARTRTANSVRVSPKPMSYAGIDLATFKRKALLAGSAWWIPQNRGNVDEDLMVSSDDQGVRVRSVADGVAREIKTGPLPTGAMMTGSDIFWDKSGNYDGSALLRTDPATGTTRSVLNAPPQMDVPDYAFNDSYFLNLVQQNRSLNPSDYHTYPILLELVPIRMKAAPSIAVYTARNP